MSQTIYRFLGFCALGCVGLLLLGAPEQAAALPPEKLRTFYIGTAIFVGLCSSIALACLIPSSHFITLRILGLIGAVGCIFYAVDSIRSGEWLRLGLPFLWFPGCLYLAIAGKMTLPDKNSNNEVLDPNAIDRGDKPQ